MRLRSLGIKAAALMLVVTVFYYLRNFPVDFDSSETEWWAYAAADDAIVPFIKRNETIAKVSSENTEGLNEYISKAERKLILFDYPPFDEINTYKLDPEQCGPCEVSYDVSQRDVAQAVIFHFTGIWKHGVTQRRFPGQIYVWMNQENPWTSLHRTKMQFGDYDNQFNLTMTYRRDSDIYFPYFTMSDLKYHFEKDAKETSTSSIIAGKSRLAVWVAGNCAYTKGAIKRLGIIRQLVTSDLDIDIFGDCVLSRLPGSWTALPRHLAPYKFYMSFENAWHCRDYVTEKVWWNALRSGVVPVIWGPLRRDVEAVLPRDSFIFVEDFASPGQLVNRLQYLDRNDDEYKRYFEWRDELLMSTNKIEQRGFCQLCLLLHADHKIFLKRGIKRNRKVTSLSRWWYGTENKECLIPTTYSESVQSAKDINFLYYRLYKLKFVSLF